VRVIYTLNTEYVLYAHDLSSVSRTTYCIVISNWTVIVCVQISRHSRCVYWNTVGMMIEDAFSNLFAFVNA